MQESIPGTMNQPIVAISQLTQESILGAMRLPDFIRCGWPATSESTRLESLAPAYLSITTVLSD